MRIYTTIYEREKEIIYLSCSFGRRCKHGRSRVWWRWLADRGQDEEDVNQMIETEKKDGVLAGRG
jgi:hypothetical protein